MTVNHLIVSKLWPRTLTSDLQLSARTPQSLNIFRAYLRVIRSSRRPLVSVAELWMM